MELLKLLKDILHKKKLGRKIDQTIPPENEKFKFIYLKKLLPFIYSHKHQAIIAAITLILASLLSLPQPLFTKYIIDDVIIKPK